MERQKVRDTDNVRLFFLAQFLIEYLLILYHREQGDLREKERNDKGKQKEGEVSAKAQEVLLGYAVIMVEMDSVKWVFSRMRITMEDRVSCRIQFRGKPSAEYTASRLGRASGLHQLLYSDRKLPPSKAETRSKLTDCSCSCSSR